jgi:hypothetical protein
MDEKSIHFLVVLTNPALIHVISAFFKRKQCREHAICEVNHRFQENQKKGCPYHKKCHPYSWGKLRNGDSLAGAGCLGVLETFRIEMCRISKSKVKMVKRSQFENPCPGSITFTKNATNNAARFGHLEVVKWLHKYRKGGFETEVMENAVSSGYLEVVHYVRSMVGDTPFLIRARLVSKIIEQGHLEILMWLHEQKSEHVEFPQNVDFTNNLEVMKFIHNNRTEVKFSNAINHASRAGNFEMVKWLHENRTEKFYGVLEGAVFSGRMDILEWLHNNLETRHEIGLPMEAAVGKGDKEMLMWLHKNRTEKITEVSVQCATRYGYFEIVKWLHLNTNQFAYSKDDAATNGHLEILEWLHENRTEVITWKAISGACLNGHIEVLNWLFQHQKKLFENHFYFVGVECLKKAAMSGNLEVVKWILTHTTIDLYSRVSMWASNHNHTKIVEYCVEFQKKSDSK